MGVTVDDGEGDGRSAGVDERKRLKVASLVETESNFATTQGGKFNVNTGDIVLNADTKFTALYIKNNEDFNLVIDALVYNLGVNTGGAGDMLIDVIRNPTTGGIISNANPVAVGTDENANLNFGESRELEVDVYKGAQGEALVNGNEVIFTRDPRTEARIFISPGGGVILPKGKSLGINYTPPPSTTAQTVQFALNCYIAGFIKS